MEKDILIQNLRTRVGEDNAKVISDKTFDGIAESVLPMFEDDSKITDETWNLPVATLIQFAGQKRFDEKEFTSRFKADYAKEYAAQHEKDVESRIAKEVEKALEEYKREHPEKGGDGGGSGEGDAIDEKVKDAVAKAIQGLTGEDSELGKSLATISSFVKDQAEREKSAQRNRVKASLKEHLQALKANNEACIDDALDDLEYGDEPTFEALKQKAVDAYEKRYKRYYSDGAKPFGGDNGGGFGAGGSFVKDKIAQLKQAAQEGDDYAAKLKESCV